MAFQSASSKATKSLLSRGNRLSEATEQISHLAGSSETLRQMPRFSAKLRESNLFPLAPTELQIFQVNVGKMCNQVCKHCHVDAGPDRREIMTKETMSLCLDVLRATPSFTTVDLTGGAPEMNPNFRWFVEEIRNLGREVIVRCNLTIILANKSYNDLPQFFAKHRVQVVSSLPFYEKSATDRQRGDGVFEKSIQALKMLNEVGFGKPETGLILNLVYNPVGAFLPGDQVGLEREYKRELKASFGIEFNSLFTITNLPVSRYLEYLIESDNLEDYMERLVSAYNPVAASNVMCRNTISVGWDGSLYDCDFNQMLDLKVATPNGKHLKDWDLNAMKSRSIIVDQHCFGCTAGAGSSCGGATT